MSRKSRAETAAALAAAETAPTAAHAAVAHVRDARPKGAEPSGAEAPRPASEGLNQKTGPASEGLNQKTGPSSEGPDQQLDYLKLTAAEIVARLDRSALNPRGDDRPEEDIRDTGISIVQHGLLEPILTRIAAFPVTAATRFEIIGGETRFLGIKAALAGITDAAGTTWQLRPDAVFWIGARVCDDDTAERLGAVENLRRKALPALREARVFSKELARARPRPGERAADVVARLFNISQRSIYRRLPLVKLAAPLQAALTQGALSLAQAEAFGLGAEKAQLAYWQRWRNAPDWQKEPGQIRREMKAELIPCAHGLFEPADYAGDIVEDHDGDRYYADPAEFQRLQQAALAAELARLKTAWPWAEIMTNPAYDAFERHGIRKSDKEAGAVIVVRGTRAEIVAPAILKAVADQRRRDRALEERRQALEAKKKAGTAGGAPESSRPPLFEAQIRALHGAKTRALRRAVANHDTAALALACLGLLGEPEVRGLQGAVDWHARHGADQYETSAHVAATRARLVLAAASRLPDGQRPAKGSDLPSFERGWDKKPADSAAWFRALVALDRLALFDLFNHLLIERIGSWAGLAAQASSTWFGDSALAQAIAEITGAATLLPDEWHPGEDYFKGYGVDRLRDFVLALPAYRDPSIKHVGAADPKRMKKADLVRTLVAQPADTWAPDRFPECRFQSDKDAAAALAGPLPRPAAPSSPAAANAAGAHARAAPSGSEAEPRPTEVGRPASEGLNQQPDAPLGFRSTEEHGRDPAELETDMLANLRQDRGASVDALADASGWSRQTVTDTLSRLFARGAARLADDGWRLPAPKVAALETAGAAE